MNLKLTSLNLTTNKFKFNNNTLKYCTGFTVKFNSILSSERIYENQLRFNKITLMSWLCTSLGPLVGVFCLKLNSPKRDV